jgi:hypothetical protein
VSGRQSVEERGYAVVGGKGSSVFGRRDSGQGDGAIGSAAAGVAGWLRPRMNEERWLLAVELREEDSLSLRTCRLRRYEKPRSRLRPPPGVPAVVGEAGGEMWEMGEAGADTIVEVVMS